MRKIHIDKEKLRKLYYDDKKTVKEISEIIDCSLLTVSSRMDDYGFKRVRRANSKTKKSISKSYLKRYYVKEDLTIFDIAKKLKCSPSTVYRYLVVYKLIKRHKLNIPRNKLIDLYYKKDLNTEDIAKELKCNQSTIVRKLHKYNIPIKKERKLELIREKLYDLYVNKKKTTYEIGEIFGFSNATVGKLLKKYKIKARKAEDNFKHIRFVGKDNFNYINIPGKELVDLRCNKNMSTYEIANIYGCHNCTISEKLKTLGIPVINRRYNGRTSLNMLIRNCKESKDWRCKVFERDDYTCQVCGKRGGDLEAHHIKSFYSIMSKFLKEYDQFSPIEDKETLVRLALKYKPFWNLDNGQTLCVECHRKTKNGLATVKEEI